MWGILIASKYEACPVNAIPDEALRPLLRIAGSLEVLQLTVRYFVDEATAGSWP